MFNEKILALWGKATPGSKTDILFHPLLAHMLDVAAVAWGLPHLALTGIPRSTLAFFVALHDIGKVSRSFQALAPAAWPTALLGSLPEHRVAAPPRHDVLGLYWLECELTDLLEDLLPRSGGWRSRAARRQLWRALAGHHGRPVEPLSTAPGPAILCEDCRLAGRDLVLGLKELFQPEPWILPLGSDLKAISWHIAGLVTHADWIGSRQAWFPYTAPDDVADVQTYWQRARAQADKALAAAGVLPVTIAPSGGWTRLFPDIQQPSPVQAWAEAVDLPEGPCLAVIEDLTGSGKTEAALLLAHRLMAAGGAEGLFVALPTMATANAMYGRLQDSAPRFFQAGAVPSLALAHGRADLQHAFRETILPDPAFSTPATALEPGEETAEVQCSAWLAEDRRRALLAQIGVGTIDQALLGVLPVRHAALRLRGLASKVLVIDEAHAFDPYMDEEVLTLLRFHAALGGSAIILSATLPQKKRAALIGAFREGLGVTQPPELTASSYPLATLAGAASLVEEPCAARPGLARDLPVRRLPDAGAALAALRQAHSAGAAAVWIRNTVDDVLAAAEALRGQGIEPLVFHARFAMQDRLLIEAEVLRRFGKSSSGKARQGILLATQVVEQSLDLDFDVLVSDLAPMDLLIQRAGRLWRHRDRNGRPVPSPELLVVSPDPVEAPAADWLRAALPGTAAVYHDPALLWRGARALFQRGQICAPGELRSLIEAAAEGETPPHLAAAADKAFGEDRAAGGQARQQVLRWAEGYTTTSGDWRPDTVTPTRKQDDPRVTLRLAVLRQGSLTPYAEAEEIRQAWSLSEISVSRRRVVACPVPAGLEAEARAVRAAWGQWLSEAPDVLLAILEPEPKGTGYRLAVESRSGDAAVLRYDARQGLILHRPASAG
ncbi:CRISPR-associated helicase/endonuclease Cas3 [Pseudoroseomonas cervicalis]|uniref:CRISPR-associated helicase Cas3 n=1 Tax=Pseudoroseomonas cervicalis ATCC 49957 TaxID=525371 RepID=D5RPS6_9PROT|nr:CRISPR-associated helicase/endonuclease Cas3 [Pseudoroseomonas cervicalis]EFH10703.1 CRISPR-associated helicase Cas3 [Pseudoroseomonas cervicalis ATCC 49957]